jgi:phospholipid/cholesterol/gamma-HCH transport system permease protein
VFSVVQRATGSIGRALAGMAAETGSIALMAATAIRTAARSMVPGGRFRGAMVIQSLWLTSASALPIAGLIAFMIGLILAFQSAYQLQRLGAERYVASLVAVAITRELGPVITAIVVAGRSGSAIAAEISSMKIQEELDALEVMGFNVMSYLVSPRVIALVIGLPLLTALADLIGIAGGLTCSVLSLGIPARQYIETAREALQLKDFITGLVKAGVFGTVIAVVGAWCGFHVEGGPEGVGKATTRAVVLGILLIIINDLIFTGLFFSF